MMAKHVNAAWVKSMKHSNMQDNFKDFWREIYTAPLRDRLRLSGLILFAPIIARVKGAWTIIRK